MDLMLLKLLYDLAHHHADTGATPLAGLAALFVVYLVGGTLAAAWTRRHWRREAAG